MSPSKIKRLIVDTPQGPAGALEKDSRFVFNYSLANGDRQREIALRMPIRAESYASTALLPIFAMNRPEGFLYNEIVRRMAKHVHFDDMLLLSIVGENQIGRLTYRVPEAAKPAKNATVGKRQLLRGGGQELFDFLVETYFDSGISGVQPKVMVPDADKKQAETVKDEARTIVHNDLVVKHSGDSFPFLTHNEFLCMDAARRAGLDVPTFDLSEDGDFFVLDRFDLRGDERLGVEDFAVLLERSYDPHGNYKYRGAYEDIAKAIKVFCREGESLASGQRFFEYLALSVLVRNGDAHLKNFSLIYDTPVGESPRLSPVYDVVTTTVYDYVSHSTGAIKTDRTMALSFAKSKMFPTREQMLQFGTQMCAVRDPARVIERISDAMTEALSANAQRIDAGLLEKMRNEWDEGRTSLLPPRVFMARSKVEEGGSRGLAENGDAVLRLKVIAESARKVHALDATPNSARNTRYYAKLAGVAAFAAGRYEAARYLDPAKSDMEVFTAWEKANRRALTSEGVALMRRGGRGD